MLLTNRLFERTPASREAKSIYIFCEGVKREYQYFEYFREMDSRINVEVHKLLSTDDNSPLGLLNEAIKCLIQSDSNPTPKYTFQPNDEVWLVFDFDPDQFDSRGNQINLIKDHCDKLTDWYFSISNPCFEVWLYYHFNDSKPQANNLSACSGWKKLVNTSISGGFDSRKHPILIHKAIINSEKNFELNANTPAVCSTDLFHLGRKIYSLVNHKIEKILKSLE